jgi:hypothetical protein
VELQFLFQTKRNLHTAQIFTLRKAIDNFYYFALILGSPAYLQDEGTWLSWLRIGFDSALVERPPAISREDRMRMETQPEPRQVAIRTESTNKAALDCVEKLVQRIEAIRGSYQGKTSQERLQGLVADPEIDQILLGPLNSALAQHKLRTDEVQRLVGAAQDGLVWATDQDIIGSSVSVTKP